MYQFVCTVKTYMSNLKNPDELDREMRPCPFCNSKQYIVKYIEEQFLIVRCKKCSLVYLGNPPDEFGIYEDYYDKSAPEKDEYSESSNEPRYAELYSINNQRIAVIKSMRPGGSLLDIGCGRGMFVKTARDEGYEAYGIDISERAVQYAIQQFDVNAKVTTLSEMTRTGKRFDIITLWHVLEHFPDPVVELKRVRSILTEGGLVFVEVPNLRSLKFILSRNKWKGGNHPRYHRTFFTAYTLRNTLTAAGFSSIRRLKLSYQVPGKNRLYTSLKKSLNTIAMDAFLDFTGQR